jgi:Phytanoyl-CoA dioxygenase (PhyH)
MDISGALTWFVAEPVRTRSLSLFVYRVGRLLNDVSKGRTDAIMRWWYARPITEDEALILDRDGILVKNWSKDYPDRDAFCRSLFKTYYGVSPRYSVDHSWTSTPSQQPSEARWHRDNTSAMTLNTFTYLCDVGEQNGPHQYQRGSHRDSNKRFAPRDNLQTPQNPDSLLTVTGPAGTTFIDVSHGLHRATHVQQGQRITAQVRYSYHAIPDSGKLGA